LLKTSIGNPAIRAPFMNSHGGVGTTQALGQPPDAIAPRTGLEALPQAKQSRISLAFPLGLVWPRFFS
jgi:hypothetical protein